MKVSYPDNRSQDSLTCVLVTSQLSNVFDILVLRDGFEGPRSDPLTKKDWCSIEYLAANYARLELTLGSCDSALHPSLARASDLLVRSEVNCFCIRKIKLIFTVDPATHRTESDHLLHCLQGTVHHLGMQSKRDLCLNFDVDTEPGFSQSELLLLRITILALQGNALLDSRILTLT